MQTINTLTDEKLREELNQRGFNIGPITPSTRKVYEHKLGKIFESEGIQFSPDANGQVAEIGQENLLNGKSRHSPSPDIQINYDSPKKSKNKSSREKSPPTLLNEVYRESDEEGYGETENSRILTPEEIRNFKSRITRSGLNDLKKLKKNRGRHTFVMAFAMIILIIGVALAYIYVPIDQLMSKFDELKDWVTSIYKPEYVPIDDKRVP